MWLPTTVFGAVACVIPIVHGAVPDCGQPPSGSQAFWVLGCAKPIVVERADPIVDPGKPSNHVHTIMGGDAFDLEMDFQKTQTSTCTTCGVTKDLSNYWVPTVYFLANNGSFLHVKQVGGINVYYQERMDWTEYCAGKTLQPFPPEFRMVAGDMTLRSYNHTSMEQRAIEFICLPDIGKTGLAPFPGFPNRTCNGGLQLRVRFPSCWDGKNADWKDHRSHMAYPSGLDNGFCPDTHPVRVPSLLYESTWDVAAFNHLREPGDQPFVLSQGDPTGYGYHGDFLNGWDTELLEKAIRDPSCGNSSGGHINFCKTFQPFFQNNTLQNLCPSIPSRVKEPVFDALPTLPGCNPLQFGPQNAIIYPCDNDTAPRPT
ncbi:hypothetical protein B0T24DRAFT_205950 [Lasiosphaeria ovina]|uniref:DUF1996 domain-containing protein n=1 Tax=Lasiosphaeria ovina TaxID=92902 RepID=A0AAE0KGU6_9PEZI|nr:hypothetical protein B0T24DRAFT_205950 [Lasiosphaeria ovina]